MVINFNWNRLLSILGLIIFIFSLIGLWSTYEKKNANESQIKVEAKILEAPKDCSIITTRSGYCTLKYNGKTHIKRAGNKFCHLVSGKETVVVLTNKNQDKLFFIGEYNSNEFISSGILLVLSILAFVKGLKD